MCSKWNVVENLRICSLTKSSLNWLSSKNYTYNRPPVLCCFSSSCNLCFQTPFACCWITTANTIVFRDIVLLFWHSFRACWKAICYHWHCGKLIRNSPVMELSVFALEFSGSCSSTRWFRWWVARGCDNGSKMHEGWILRIKQCAESDWIGRRKRDVLSRSGRKLQLHPETTWIQYPILAPKLPWERFQGACFHYDLQICICKRPTTLPCPNRH